MKKSIFTTLVIVLVMSLMSTSLFAANQYYDFGDDDGYFAESFTNAHNLLKTNAFSPITDESKKTNVEANLGKRGSIQLVHETDRINFLSFENKAPVTTVQSFQNSTKIKLALITIKNNSRDGFELLCQTSNDFQLNSVGSADGEEPLKYKLNIIRMQGGQYNLSEIRVASDLDSNNDKHIFEVKNKNLAQTAKVDAGIEVELEVITPGAQTAIQMAGDYKDTITYTYRDL